MSALHTNRERIGTDRAAVLRVYVGIVLGLYRRPYNIKRIVYKLIRT